jgi:hypothetical protein
VDGVTVNDYAIQPERDVARMNTIGVFCHEFGHALGLPDLYDTDYTSWGIGDWGIMAFGSYNKDTNDGDSPAHFTAWSKYFLGWVTPTQILSTTLPCAPIDRASNNADVYQLLSGTPTSGEYFLVENRQKAGFDQGLPGEGLLIWHIDGDTIDSKRSANTVNDSECYPGGPSCATNHYGVALVPADNLWDLEQKIDQGDSGDPFPGSTNNTLFTDTSSPNSDLYDGSESTAGVGNIAYSSGRYVAFESEATNLVANDTNNAKDIFVYDRDEDTIERVSVADNGTAGDFASYNASISSDGRYVAFDSLASNLVPGDTNGSGNVYVYDRTNDTIEHVNTSYDATEESWSGSQRPFISSDGAFIAFDSDATNLVANDTNGSKDIFIAPSGASGSSTSTTVDSTSTTVTANTTTTTALITTTTSIEELCPTELLYGEHSNEAELLRHWRDNVLSNVPEGREIIRLYYEWSPVMVKALEEDEEFKEEVKELIDGILPLLGPEAE